ncbi:MAG: hypothetical protein ACR2LR_15880 [Hassallia sp.]
MSGKPLTLRVTLVRAASPIGEAPGVETPLVLASPQGRRPRWLTTNQDSILDLFRLIAASIINVAL